MAFPNIKNQIQAYNTYYFPVILKEDYDGTTIKNPTLGRGVPLKFLKFRCPNPNVSSTGYYSASASTHPDIYKFLSASGSTNVPPEGNAFSYLSANYAGTAIETTSSAPVKLANGSTSSVTYRVSAFKLQTPISGRYIKFTNPELLFEGSENHALTSLQNGVPTTGLPFESDTPTEVPIRCLIQSDCTFTSEVSITLTLNFSENSFNVNSFVRNTLGNDCTLYYPGYQEVESSYGPCPFTFEDLDTTAGGTSTPSLSTGQDGSTRAGETKQVLYLGTNSINRDTDVQLDSNGNTTFYFRAGVLYKKVGPATLASPDCPLCETLGPDVSSNGGVTINSMVQNGTFQSELFNTNSTYQKSTNSYTDNSKMSGNVKHDTDIGADYLSGIKAGLDGFGKYNLGLGKMNESDLIPQLESFKDYLTEKVETLTQEAFDRLTADSSCGCSGSPTYPDCPC
jgi:hypothetical protein